MKLEDSLRRRACHHFVGRAEELARLDSFLSKRATLLCKRGRRSDTPPLKVAILHGIRGVGKTQLAVQYALRKAAKTLECRPILIEASTSEAFLTALESFLLEIRSQSERTPRRMQRWQEEDRQKITIVRGKLETAKTGWILVIDHVTDETVEHVQHLIPRQATHASSIIVTTSLAHIADVLKKGSDTRRRGKLHLFPMNVHDSLSMIRKIWHNSKHHPSPQINESVLKFVTEIGCVPALLEQTASWLLAHRGRDIQFDARTIESIYKSESLMKPCYDSYSFYMAYNEPIQKLAMVREVAADFLRILCFFDWEQIDVIHLTHGLTWEHHVSIADIDESTFLRVNERLNHLQSLLSDPTETKMMLSTLVMLGILQTDPKSKICSFVDSSVQRVARMALMSDEKTRRMWLMFTLRVFEGGMSNLPASIDRCKRMKRLRPHIQSLWALSQQYQCPTAFICSAVSFLGECLHLEGQYLEAIHWSERGILGACHVGRYSSDKEAGKEAIMPQSYYKFKLGTFYLKAADVMIQATAMREQLLQQAEGIAEEALKPKTTKPGRCTEARTALRLLIDVWIARNNVDKLADALESVRKAIMESTTDTSSENTEYLQLMDTLVKAELHVGRSTSGEDLLRDALELGKATLAAKLQRYASDDAEVIETKLIVAQALWACSDCSTYDIDDGKEGSLAHQAIVLMLSISKHFRQTHGRGHPETVRIAAHLEEWRIRLELESQSLYDHA